MKIYTTGSFDILHRGHFNILTQAAALGDLIVGIQSDEWIEKQKGRRPILTTEERIAQIRALPFVKEVIEYGDPDQRPIYDQIRPDAIVQGDDWLYSADRSDLIAYLKEKNIRLILLPRTEGISTTEIRKRVERSKRNDEKFLLDRVRMVPIEDLRLYEKFDSDKVSRLMEAIGKD
ncbi:MAG TPA: adenylyltransferase/cytidyltransferase family protein, partial [Candidatus Colwellbacteria bacterium]|nr:adenylyltransferase/cytidyltransferase family protein [Candidatus Colwellbacteria bacterium]